MRLKGSKLNRLRGHHAQVSVAVVTKVVAETMDVKAVEILSPTRGSPNAARARKIVYYLAHTEMRVSILNIAEVMERDRKPVRSGIQSVEETRETDGEMDDLLERMVKRIFPQTNTSPVTIPPIMAPRLMALLDEVAE